MARGQAHPPEVKAAVMASLIAGQGVNEVAREFKLSRSVVSRWRDQMPQEHLRAVQQQKGARLEELLFEYLAANLRALKAQAEVAADEKYLRVQPAPDLAVLHGVMADKAVRLFEAIERAADTEEATEGGAG